MGKYKRLAAHNLGNAEDATDIDIDDDDHLVELEVIGGALSSTDVTDAQEVVKAPTKTPDIQNGDDGLESAMIDATPTSGTSATNPTNPTNPINCTSRFAVGRFIFGFHVWFQTILKRCFFKLGMKVGSYPWMTVVLSIFTCVTVTTGVLEGEMSASPLMWVSHGSQAYHDLVWRNKHFGADNISMVVMGISKRHNNNDDDGDGDGVIGILTPHALYEMAQLQRNLSSGVSVQGKTLVPDACAKRCVASICTCVVDSILNLWKDAATGVVDPDLIPGSSDVILEMISNRGPEDGIPVIESFLGKVVFGSRPQLHRHRKQATTTSTPTEGSDYVIGAKAIMIHFELDNNIDVYEQVLWQQAFIQRCLQASSGLESVEVLCETPREWIDESDRSLDADMVFFAAAIVLMIVYVSLVLGRCHRVRGRQLLSLAVVLLVGFGLGCGFGAAGYIGLKSTQLSLMAIFILLGLGVDNMFLLVDTFDRFDADGDNLGLRCAHTLEEIGTSVLFTSVTDFVAFLTGSTLDLPAVHAFCTTAAISILCLFMITVTLFMGLLVLDERRRRQNRCDVAPCIVSASKPVNTKHISRISGFMSKYYGPFITHKVVSKVIPIVFVLKVVGLGYYGFTHLHETFDPTIYVPDDSPLKTFVNVQAEYFGKFQALDLFIGPANLTTTESIQSICELDKRIKQLSFVITDDTVLAWTTMYTDSIAVASKYFLSGDWDCNSTTLPSPELVVFAQSALRGLAVSPGIFSDFFKIGPEGTLGKITLMVKMDKPYGFNFVQMHESRKVVSGLAFPGHAFTQEFLQSHLNEEIDDVTFNTLSSTVFAVLGISLLVLSPLEAFVNWLCTVFTVVDIFALMGFWEISLNAPNLALLCLSVGFSVDYSAHIVKAVSVQALDVPRKDAICKALREQGVSVLHAGLSTMVAVLMLAVSKSAGYHVLFQLMFGTVVFGIAHGLVFLPAVLMYTPRGW